MIGKSTELQIYFLRSTIDMKAILQKIFYQINLFEILTREVTLKIEILFDQEAQIAKVNDFKKTFLKIFHSKNSQDMVSVFYYLRNF